MLHFSDRASSFLHWSLPPRQFIIHLYIHLINSFLPVPSGPPVNLSVQSTSSVSITLSWGLPIPAHRNGIITGYTMRITLLASQTRTEYSTTHTSYTVGSLRPYTSYSCVVAARTINGTGPFSNVTEVRTQETRKFKNSINTKRNVDLFVSLSLGP